MQMFEKMQMIDHWLTRTGGTRHVENTIFFFFFCLNFELTLIKQTTFNKQGSTHKNTCHKWLVHNILHAWIPVSYMSSHHSV